MWVWDKLSAVKWLDAWEERFRGNSNLVINLLKGGKTLRVEVFCESKPEASAIAERFGGRVRELKNADWQKPAEIPPPLKIRNRLVVTQEGGAEKLAVLEKQFPGRELLSIPPEMAFGTGDHATTSTCLRFLVDIGRERGLGWSCIDLGCGSGLLAIAACKLGASPVFGCDFDPFAVVVAARNCQRNGAAAVEIAELDVLKWKPRRSYDVVVANLFSTVLIETFPVICKLLNPGGELVLSGILASQAWEVFEAGARAGLGFPKIVKKGKWVSARGGWLNDLVEKQKRE